MVLNCMLIFGIFFFINKITHIRLLTFNFYLNSVLLFKGCCIFRGYFLLSFEGIQRSLLWLGKQACLSSLFMICTFVLTNFNFVSFNIVMKILNDIIWIVIRIWAYLLSRKHSRSSYNIKLIIIALIIAFIVISKIRTISW